MSELTTCSRCGAEIPVGEERLGDKLFNVDLYEELCPDCFDDWRRNENRRIGIDKNPGCHRADER